MAGRGIWLSGPALFEAIPRRQSTRGDYDGSADLPSLSRASAVPGVDLVLISDRPQMNRARDLVVEGNTAQIADAAFVRELKSRLRFSPRQAINTSDGLFSATTGNPALPAWLGPVILDFVFKADAENKKSARQIASSSGIAVFVSQQDNPEHWVLAGRACQRFALQATALCCGHTGHAGEMESVVTASPLIFFLLASVLSFPFYLLGMAGGRLAGMPILPAGQAANKIAETFETGQADAGPVAAFRTANLDRD